jgi:SEC-C motif-containing protein
MINVPEHPFRVSEVDENEPFIANALRARKHYEPCWCSSGKKYKKCHRKRREEQPYSLGKLQKLQRKVFWQKRGCMHPLASPNTCKGKVIDSHTIQRKGPLERIVDSTGHVMHFEADLNDGGADATSIGWRKASVFPGYCSFHDSTLFEPIENGGFTGDHKQCVLHAFRNVCNEHYRKQALIDSFEFQRTSLDRGFDLDRQINTQFSIKKSIEGQKKSLEETGELRDIFEDAIVQGNYEAFKSKCFFFKGNLDVVSSSVFQCEFDFSGNKLIDMWDPSLDAEMLSHTIVDTDDGGAIIFVWIKGQNHPETVVESFNNLPDDEKGDIFVQYCFVNCENTFFSDRWWSALDNSQKVLIQRYAAALYYEGGEYAANENRLVSWVMV